MTWVDDALDADRSDTLRWHAALAIHMFVLFCKGVGLMWALIVPMMGAVVMFSGGRDDWPLDQRIAGFVVGTFGLAVLLSPGGMLFFIERYSKRHQKRLEPEQYLRAYDKAMSARP